AVSRPWALYWIVAEEAEMASYRTTGTYVDAVSPPGTNVVSGRWLYKLKRPPGSPPVFKARYVARGFSQREGVDFFQTFAPTPKMTTLRVLLHIAAQRNYELHSLDFSTAFLQGSLHEQIWLPLDFFPLSADPSLFVRRGSTPFFVLVYVDDLVFATPDQRTHILTRFCFSFSKVQLTPLVVDHGLTAPPLSESFESNGPYPKLVGCLVYLMFCTRPNLAYPLSVRARFAAPGRHRPSHWYAAKRVAKHVVSTSCVGLVLGGKQPVTLTGYSDSSWADDVETCRSTQGCCFVVVDSGVDRLHF
ncbi:unnamed protein product, partial [Closterium sp. NIES-53]